MTNGKQSLASFLTVEDLLAATTDRAKARPSSLTGKPRLLRSLVQQHRDRACD